MTVVIAAWDNAHAHAHVDGVRVRVRRYQRLTRWICDQHGRADDFHLCEHTEALAAEPVPTEGAESPSTKKPQPQGEQP